jgi:hypothetical protein
MDVFIINKPHTPLWGSYSLALILILLSLLFFNRFNTINNSLRILAKPVKIAQSGKPMPI